MRAYNKSTNSEVILYAQKQKYTTFGASLRF
jgi:hypothetical protein